MKQLRDFDPAKSGSKPGYCLQNVRLGYSIPAKYSSAWQAWNNTTQFKNRTFPKGVDIPLYYDYTDSNGKRYGHINVLLSDGSIWNDGKRFANLENFELYHKNVKFVGWSDAVNNVKVIEEESMYPSVKDVRYFFITYLKEEPTQRQIDLYTTRPWQEMMNNVSGTLRNSLEDQSYKVSQAGEKIANRDKEIAKLKEELANSEYQPITEQLYKKGK